MPVILVSLVVSEISSCRTSETAFRNLAVIDPLDPTITFFSCHLRLEDVEEIQCRYDEIGQAKASGIGGRIELGEKRLCAS